MCSCFCVLSWSLLILSSVLMPPTFTMGEESTVSTVCVHVTCSYTSNSPERTFVPSVSASSVPSVSGSPSAMEMRLSQHQQHSPHLSPSGHTPTLSSSPIQQLLHHSSTFTSGLKWVRDHRSNFSCLSQTKDLKQSHIKSLYFASSAFHISFTISRWLTVVLCAGWGRCAS